MSKRGILSIARVAHADGDRGATFTGQERPVVKRLAKAGLLEIVSEQRWRGMLETTAKITPAGLRELDK